MTLRMKWWDGSSWRDERSVADATFIPPSAVATKLTLVPSAYSVPAGGTINFVATVKRSDNNAAVTVGNCTLEQYAGGVWSAVGTDTVDGSGVSNFNNVGPASTRNYRVKYAGSGIYVASTSGTVTITVTSAPSESTYVKTYSATWSQAYKENGSQNTVVGNDVYQGYYSSTNGNQKSLIGFNDSAIRSDLAGATITKVEFFLNITHWYNNAGGTLRIGTHRNSDKPGTFPGSGTNVAKTTKSCNTGGIWHNIGTGFGNDFKNDDARGILIGPGASTSKEYYGYGQGDGASYQPQLRITYKK